MVDRTQEDINQDQRIAALEQSVRELTHKLENALDLVGNMQAILKPLYALQGDFSNLKVWTIGALDKQESRFKSIESAHNVLDQIVRKLEVFVDKVRGTVGNL